MLKLFRNPKDRISHYFIVYLLVFSGKDSGAELEDSMFTPRREKPVEKMQYDDLMAEYLKLAEAMNVIKKELAMLQDLVSQGGNFSGRLA